MSRIGKKPIKIPNGVTVSAANGLLVIKGPKGELTRSFPPNVFFKVEGDEVNVTVANPEEKFQKSLWGTFGAHVRNMVAGVTEGFSRTLEVNGVGYRVSLEGTNKLNLLVGLSHPVIFELPPTVSAKVEKNQIILASHDLELLGRIASEIRAVRKPEPYKGKGIKYVEETIRRKAGKAAKAGA